MAGFRYAGSLVGTGEPVIRKYVLADGEVISKNQILNLESGEADAGATNDSAFIGAAVESVDNTDDGLSIHVICNPDAIYAVDDANVRVAGATLDLASGGMGVAASSNADFVVVADSAADEPTLVVFNSNHYLG
ncbi:hypothetical protein G4Y79_15265 [Phototrophicus methaneseepsis]|uniref:Uncharacterized protein n=1 Tax=Phototrophicus methaneseepsis TaxID=2710758 RepID=A0A7S8E629_9CHLR|nr:hypothetical protein [Phototrophicus methaneseepsis]QPC81062.1 hypothetical protein G4Y79_15265 [Phototrophicus methaneseepsis]